MGRSRGAFLLYCLLSACSRFSVGQHLLLAQAASDAQKKGRPGQLVDPRPQTVDGGEIKIVVTPQLVHDIFEEYPVVSKAYSENVPSKVGFPFLPIYPVHADLALHSQLSEADFWKRYFQSKLFSSHQASIRSTAAQHVVKDDPIFDKYLERPDDGELPPGIAIMGLTSNHLLSKSWSRDGRETRMWECS